MTQNDGKPRSSQLSFEFSRHTQCGAFEASETRSVVTHFVSREVINTRKEAIERVRRDGIFSVNKREKA